MISLMGPMITLAATTPPDGCKPKYKITKAKEPYNGILMTECHFRYYEKYRKDSEILDLKLKELSEAKVALDDDISLAWYILGGVLLGFAGAKLAN